MPGWPNTGSPGGFRFTPEQNRPFREILMSPEVHKTHGDNARRIWTDVMREIKEMDCFHNLQTIYPAVFPYPYPATSANQILDESLLDFDMLHDYDVPGLFRRLDEYAKRDQPRPVVMCCGFDGESSSAQKRDFLACILHGAAGYVYSNGGMYFVNDDKQVFGPSGHGCCWTRQTWMEGIQERARQEWARAKR